MTGCALTRADKVKDLGVWFDEKLFFKDHIHDKIYTTLGIVERNFKHLTVPTFVLLYTIIVRSINVCSKRNDRILI